MTSRECEEKLLNLMADAWALFKEYNPNGAHLTMFATADGCCAMGYKPSAEGKERIVDGYLSPDGCYRFSE